MILYTQIRQIARENLDDGSRSNIYLLLDHAGLPGLHQKLQSVCKDWISLFNFTAEKNALAASPILLFIGDGKKIKISHHIIEWIEKKGIYSSTIILLVSQSNLENLSSRLTTRLNVKLTENRNAMLRFYDPRIFQALLKVLTAEQRTTLLAPAKRLLYVDRTGKFVEVASVSSDDSSESAAPLELSAEQESTLNDDLKSDYVLEKLKETAFELIHKQPISFQYDFVVKNIEIARKFGFTSIADLVLYNIVALTYGPEFMTSETWLKKMHKNSLEVKSFTGNILFSEIIEESNFYEK